MSKYILVLTAALLFASCSKQWQPVSYQAERLEVAADLPEDNAVLQTIAPFKKDLDQEMNVVLAYNESKLVKGKPESDLGNLIADMVLDEARSASKHPVDFSVVNYGGIRVPYLSEGNVTVGSVYELMPFDNFIVVMHMNGGQAKALINSIAGKGGWPVSGLSFVIDEDLAKEIHIGGKPLDEDGKYGVAMPDYIANGGDRMWELKEIPREELDLYLRDALIEHMRKMGESRQSLTAQIEGRIRYAE